MKKAAGYLLIDSAAAYVILVFAVVSLLPIYNLSIKASERSVETLKAAELAQELMEEVKLRRWDQNSTRPGYPAYKGSTIGIDGAESSSNKTTFNDVDDFNGWSETGVQDPLGNTIAGLGAYNRTVTVQYLNASDFSVSASTTAYKQVQVCVTKSSSTVANATKVCLNWLATNY